MVMRSYDPQQEEEANWLAWTILLPREALTEAVRARLSTPNIAPRDGVSKQLVEYRIGMTGVKLELGRSRRRFA
jgi:hypothetical protein